MEPLKPSAEQTQATSQENPEKRRADAKRASAPRPNESVGREAQEQANTDPEGELARELSRLEEAEEFASSNGYFGHPEAKSTVVDFIAEKAQELSLLGLSLSDYRALGTEDLGAELEIALQESTIAEKGETERVQRLGTAEFEARFIELRKAGRPLPSMLLDSGTSIRSASHLRPL